MLRKNNKYLISSLDVSIDRVLSDLYRSALSLCLVCDEGKRLCGILTLSDIKSALLKGSDPQAPVSSLMNTQFTAALHGTSAQTLKKMALKQNPLGTGPISRIPLLDRKQKLKGLYELENVKKLERSTVLVTGGAGYVGSHLCRLLLKEGFCVVVLDKLLFGDAGIKDLYKNKDFTLIRGDIGDIGTLIKALSQVDYVVHLAGIVGDPASALSPMQTMEENHFATRMLTDLCQHYQVSRFVFASSCSVYGASDHELNEGSELNPVSLYAQSKLYSERDLLAAKGPNFNPVVLRFGTVYGLSPRMRFDLVVNIMTAHAYFNKKIRVDGGDQWRPLLHVEDAARACLAALKAPLSSVSGQVFNVGDSKENYTIADIALAVQKNLPKASIEYLDVIKDRRDYRVSFKKINKVMGFKTKHSMPKKISEIANALKSGKLKDWKNKRYNNYLTLRSAIEKMSL